MYLSSVWWLFLPWLLDRITMNTSVRSEREMKVGPQAWGVRPGARPLLIHATMSIYPRTATYFFAAFASGSQRLADLEKLMGYPSQFREEREDHRYGMVLKAGLGR